MEDINTAILLHGVCDHHEYYEMDFPSPSNAHWFPWLQQKLLRSGILCQTLEMPQPYAPDYNKWAAVFSTQNVGISTHIIGHSAGCGFILKWLSDNPNIHIGRLTMVAPWIDPSHECGDFLSGARDPMIIQRIGQCEILHSSDDMKAVCDSMDILEQEYSDIPVHRCDDKGHFCFSDLGGGTFPELWDIINTDSPP